ncbi:hypothetical protein FBT53_14470 [Flavobacterium sp. ASW18X]|nr:hypothetical protein FBT53_14470 [Flavobacterium sp. ASW18X]
MSFSARPSFLYAFIKCIPIYIGSFFLMGFLFRIASVAKIPILFPFAFVCLFNLYFILKVYMVRFDFNEDYITITKGVFSRERKTIELFRIKDIRESRPFFLRLIGVMNVELITSQKFSRYTTLKGVRKNDFIGILRQNILDQRHRNRVHEIDS